MKKLNFLFKMMIISGIFFIFGTAGASDLERLDLWDIISNILLGIILVLTGNLGTKITKTRKESTRKRMRKSKPVPVRRANIA